jgi:MtN3 and saliva related transmembrane protein
MDWTTLLGFMAGVLTTISFWPQLWKTWKTKSAGDVSLGMLLTFSVGVLLWLLYGVLLGAWPIIVTNLITVLLTMTILVLKLRYDR